MKHKSLLLVNVLCTISHNSPKLFGIIRARRIFMHTYMHEKACTILPYSCFLSRIFLPGRSIVQTSVPCARTLMLFLPVIFNSAVKPLLWKMYILLHVRMCRFWHALHVLLLKQYEVDRGFLCVLSF